MRYRRLGRSGLLVSELCLGTNTFGGGANWKTLGALDQTAANAVVGAAHEAGINFIDTADMYGAGESEQIVGQSLRDLGIARGDMVLATKVGGRMGKTPNDLGASRAHIIAGVEASLKRLNTDYIDVYMIHFADPATPIEETVRALDDLVRAGKIRYAGCSNFPAWLFAKAHGVAAREALHRFEIMESHYSLLTRDLDEEVMPMAADAGLGLLIWGPLLGGLLSGKYGRDGGGEGRMGGHVPDSIGRDRLFDAIDVLRPIADRLGASPAQVALAWVLQRPAITSVLFGSRNPDQVRDNVAASDLVLSAEDVAALDTVGARPVSYAHTVVGNAAKDRMPYR
ncbi:aldo/keto reductase [Sphingomonas crocodyli]|uniref:Aldo/keto reductase n=1 Tax=Sphingomonas crocodyli TaxID=1979270 RepID=A0A437LWW8_9SPHN|nr:aldo/keto reductase [Sphingomonas crocodyli]RVT89898.1 aldo/keto reductase [Sphingomonas crocodyli]